MIGKISGIIDYRAEDHVLIDVRGVGYLVHVSDRTLMALPAAGEAAALYTDLIVREDLMQLFGFLSLVEKEWFRLLLTVQGVGAKAAIAILGALGAEGVGRAVALGDVNAIKAARGIGPKTAQRVVIELKDKAPGLMAMAGRGGSAAPEVSEASEPATAPARTRRPRATPAPRANEAAGSEALSALTNLGYGPADAAGAVAQAAQDAPDAATGDLIRAALRLLAPKG